jgi:hypothetical protein
MLRPIFASACCALLLTCCQKDQSAQKTAQVTSKMGLKPIVAVVPVIDTTKNELSWSLSDELTGSIQQRLAQKNKLFLVDLHQVRAQTKKLDGAINPFGTDLSWMKKSFAGDEFVVFMELIEHEELFVTDKKKPDEPQNCAVDLNMAMRLRVVDLRGEQPVIVLQELVHNSHFIPKPFTSLNFYQVPWGEDLFSISPIGLAHAAFCKEIASRVEDYILLSEKNAK